MDHTLGYTLFGAGKLPAKVRESIDAKDVVAEGEGIRVEESFRGEVPGLHAGGRAFRFSGAVVLTRTRILGTLGSWTAIDATWDGDGPVELKVDETALTLHVDVGRIDPTWKGELQLVFHRPFAADELARLPSRVSRCSMPREHILQLAGARPKKDD